MGAREEASDIYFDNENNAYAIFQTQASDIMYNLQMGYLYSFKQTTSIQDYSTSSKTSSVILYPNPTDSELCIKNMELDYRNFRFISSSGKLILEGNQLQECFDLSSFEAGLYFLVIEDKSGQRQYSTFYKN